MAVLENMVLRRGLTLPCLVSLLSILACDTPQVVTESVRADLVVEPPDCLAPPPGAADLAISGTTNNNPPVQPGDPSFPAVLCETLAVAWPPVGPVRAYLTSDATVTSTLVGSAPMHAEACLFGPPGTVLADLRITTPDGDTLDARIKVTSTPDSPPAPNREGTGTGIITGGTGRFADATGEFNINAKSHGTVHPGTNVATFRDIALCGYVQLSDAE